MEFFVKNALVDSYAKIFKVNILTGEYEVYKNDGLFSDEELDAPTDIYEYVKRLIATELVYPEYATACRRFTNPEYVQKSVFSGEKRIVQSYRRRTDMGDRWVTFAIIANQGCTPENPIVLFTWREADSDTITLLDTLPTVSSLYDKLIRVNLSNNTYEPILVSGDEQEQLSGGVIDETAGWAAYPRDQIAPEDAGAFTKLTTDESLKSHFSKTSTPISFRYRRKIDDEYRWTKLEIVPSVEYSEENQVVLLSLKDIHEEYTAQSRKRQELLDNMNRDALTNLFNRLKFNADIDNLERNSDSLFTCLYIDVNGLHELNNLLGHQKGDDMLCCVASTLTKHFPDESVYRIGGDEFVVTSTKLSKPVVELIIERVRHELNKDNYAISVGIATGVCGQNIEKVIELAELEMRNDKSAYYMQNGDRRRKRQMNEELEQMLVEKHDNERFLDIIAHQFSGVYLVDLVCDTLRHIYLPDFFSELLEETDARFSAAMRLYVERFVEPEYRDRFEDIVNYEKLDKKLSETEVVQFTYQKTDGICMKVRILKLDRSKDKNAETIWIFEKGAAVEKSPV